METDTECILPDPDKRQKDFSAPQVLWGSMTAQWRRLRTGLESFLILRNLSSQDSEGTGNL